MSRAMTLVFAIAAYAIFFATFLYLIVFVGDFTFSSRGGYPRTSPNNPANLEP